MKKSCLIAVIATLAAVAGALAAVAVAASSKPPMCQRIAMASTGFRRIKRSMR